MTTWNDIPFDENATPQEKADEFDAQYSENRDEEADDGA